MNKLQELLASEPYLLLDGAMGTMLMESGLESGAPPEEWNETHPDLVQDVHRSYLDAGAQIILTNSFGGTRYRLKLHDLQDRVIALNKAAAVNARAAVNKATRPAVVAGSMGPTGELLEPLGNMSFEDAIAAFAEQAKGLDEGGVDVLWVETMSDLNEVRAAVEGARSVSALPLVATMTFDTNGHTMMGVSPRAAVVALSELDLVAFGGNCGNGPEEIAAVIETMSHINSAFNLVAKSNAGLPKWEDDELKYDGTPEVMADYAVRVRDLGARLIGACCGSTPAHIRAMSEALVTTEPTTAKTLADSSREIGSLRDPEKPLRARRFQRG